MTPIEARFEIERQLVAMAVAEGVMPLVCIRFFPYPGDGQFILAVAEFVDGRPDILQSSRRYALDRQARQAIPLVL